MCLRHEAFTDRYYGLFLWKRFCLVNYKTVCVHCPVEALEIIWKHWKKSSGTAEKPYREEVGVDERVQNMSGL